ncbi:hypothetical protein GCM10007913_25750 [Devosia yakushimensis]|uniref:MOFRL-associated domain-containing protein n=1 Tax=Devosia yakushimensis TaxID=470028 RepID=A0ABQ5UF10_9HYPH|nr:hypothetical protein GCM10007913_25750 [Devosia yakushimensis]
MAQALKWLGPLSGHVVTSHGNAVSCHRIEISEASHPIPDQAGLAAAGRILAHLKGLTEDDLVIALISGGGSALLPGPASPLTLFDEQEIYRALSCLA